MTVQRTIHTHVPHVTTPPSPAPILELGMAFWGSKALLSAVELGVFTVLGQGPRTGRDLEAALALAPRATYDFLDALVSLGILARDGAGEAGFRHVEVIPLGGPASAAVAYKERVRWRGCAARASRRGSRS